jgi:hypothetical protein
MRFDHYLAMRLVFVSYICLRIHPCEIFFGLIFGPLEGSTLNTTFTVHTGGAGGNF